VARSSDGPGAGRLTRGPRWGARARGFLGKGVVALCSASAATFMGRCAAGVLPFPGSWKRKEPPVPSNKWQDDGPELDLKILSVDLLSVPY